MRCVVVMGVARFERTRRHIWVEVGDGSHMCNVLGVVWGSEDERIDCEISIPLAWT
jgi:hypothetical protein